MKGVFLLGAGFSAAANRYFENVPLEHQHLARRYPLASELAAECFDPSYDLTNGVEEAFSAAIYRRDPGPIQKLCDIVQRADEFVGSRAANDHSSILRRLLRAFPGSNYLSFNYDCLLELTLFRDELWSPKDGFGIAAGVEKRHLRSETKSYPDSSKIKVLHLHGSLYLYPVEFELLPEEGSDIMWLSDTHPPRFEFDPDALGGRFFPFQRRAIEPSFRLPQHRIIVPVVNKAEDLRQSYVREIYQRAKEIVSTADTLIAIGYSFAESDRSSYEPLLATLCENRGRVFVVSPHSKDIVAKFSLSHPSCDWEAIRLTLEGWATRSFAGVL